MMTRRKIILVLLSMILISSLAIAEPVVFSDSKLKDAIEVELGKLNPDTSDLLSLTELKIRFRRITSLKGIEHAKNLKSLNLIYNKIEDISSLTGLVKLETLNLAGNKISDISSLSKLTNLKELSLEGNEINDISLLSKFYKLESLDFSGNHITDVSPVSKLIELKKLKAFRNQISDISPIAGLINLTSLTISENNIKDISAISGMSKLEDVFLRDNPIRNLYVIKGLPRLTKFNGFKVAPGFDPVPEYTFIKLATQSITRIFFGALLTIYISILVIRFICKKKIRLFNSLFQMFKWLLITILPVSLIFGFHFHAPAKYLILIIIIIFFMASLLVPHKKRIWLIAAQIVTGIIIILFAPEDTSVWKPYTLENELANFNLKRAIPSEDNAAMIYNKLLENYDFKSDEFSTPFLSSEDYTNTECGFWKTKDYPELAKWLEQHKGLFDLVIKVSDKSKCYFPFSMEYQLSYPTDNLAGLKKSCILLIQSANNDVAEGEIDSAVEKYGACTQVGTHLQQQPNLISYLVAIACHALVEERLNELVVTGKLTKKQLDNIEQVVTSIPDDWQSLWTNIMEGECLIAKRLLIIDYEASSSGKARISLNTDKGLLVETKKIFRIPTEYDKTAKKEILFQKTCGISKWFYMPSNPQKAEAVVDDLHKDYFKMAMSDYQWGNELNDYPAKQFRLDFRSMCKVYLDMSAGNYIDAHNFFVEKVERRNALLLMVELKRFHNLNNRWPEKLEQIESRTSISADNFIYKPKDDSFMLYSKGIDGIDNNGKPVNRYKRKPEEPDDIVFWPLPPRKKTK